VEEASVSYAILPSSIPFTTTGTWANDSSNFYVVPTTSSGFNPSSDQTITGNWQFENPIQTVYDGTNYADAIYYQQVNALNLLKLGDGNNFAGANVNGKLYVDGAETIRRITANTSVYVATTGNDTTGDGTNGSPFATPHKALEFMQNWIMDKDVTVTISVAAGVYNFTEQIEMNHPCSANIILQGSGNAAAPNASTNVTRADIESAFDTRFYFTGANGIVSTQNNTFNISKFALLGDTTNNGIYCDTNANVICGDASISVDGFQNGLLCTTNGYVRISSGTASNNSSYGIYSLGGYVFFTSSSSTNNADHSIYANNTGYIEADSSTSANNGRSGYRAVLGSSIRALNIANVTGNGDNGFYADNQSIIRRSGATGNQASNSSPAIGVEGNNGSWVI
jgi:hypothetical protein